MTPASSPKELQPIHDETSSQDRGRFLRAALASGLFHATLIALLIGLWRPAPPAEPPAVIPVTLAGEEGVAGAASIGNGAHASAAPSNTSAAATASSSPAAPSASMPPPTAKTTPSATTSAAPSPLKPTPALEPVPPRKPLPPRPTPEKTAQVPPRSPTPAAQAPMTTPMLKAPPTASPSPSSITATASTAAGDGASQSAGGSGRAAAGTGRSDAGNGAPQRPGDDYLELLRDWIARFQHYPDDAIKKRQEGVVSVGFKFARDGTVLDVWIEKSSGYPLLDNAALKMIHDASPLPKPPPRYKGDTLTLVMPERFRIGLFDRIFH